MLKIWKKLSGEYRQEYNKQKNQKSGAGAYCGTFTYYDDMDFLSTYIEHRPSISSLQFSYIKRNIKGNESEVQYETVEDDLKEKLESHETDYESNYLSDNALLTYAQCLNTHIFSTPYIKQKIFLQRVLKVILKFQKKDNSGKG